MILATNNKGKIREISKILQEENLKSLKDLSIDVEVDEDQNTFYGNARKKAHEIYELTKEAVIADDSGLEIEALGGFPSVLTHRFLGEEATDRERNMALLEKLKNEENRQAQVVCVLVYFDGKQEIVGEGILKGTIAKEIRGTNGFGFDEIFELPDGRTLAELSMDEKNTTSARYLAAIDLKQKWKK